MLSDCARRVESTAPEGIMITFRLTQHSVRPVQVVEILHDGKVCGTIVPMEGTENVIRVISAHLFGAGTDKGISPYVHVDDHIGEAIPIPDIRMVFDPGEYIIEGGRIVRARPDGSWHWDRHSEDFGDATADQRDANEKT